MNITTWFQLGTVGMVLGTLAMGYAMTRVPEERYRESLLLIGVGAIAAVAYALMSFGVGMLSAQDGHTIYLARYVDWLLTTPLNVLYLCVIAGVSRRYSLEVSVVQALTIVFGIVGAYLAGPAKWLMFAVGALLFARVLYLLYGPVADSMAETNPQLLGLYRTLLNFIAVLWLVYPVIWVLAQSGVGLLDLETQTLVISYLDVVAKIGFGLIALNGVALTAALARDDGQTGDQRVDDAVGAD